MKIFLSTILALAITSTPILVVAADSTAPAAKNGGDYSTSLKKNAPAPSKSKKAASQSETKNFDPPVWCGDPCSKCSLVCNKRDGHSGDHRDSNRHTW